MVEKRAVHAVLGVVGMIAWVLFILGCVGTVSWSPDGSRILFSYYDPAAKTKGVAVYDLRTSQAKSVFSRPVPPKDKDEDTFGFMAQWESDGERALIAMPYRDAKEYDLFAVPLVSSSKRSEQHFILPDADNDWGYMPYPEVDGRLYVNTSNYVAAVNLRTGATETTPVAPFTFLGQSGNRIIAVRSKSAPENRDKPQAKPAVIPAVQDDAGSAAKPEPAEAHEDIQFGLVDPRTSSFELKFELREADWPRDLEIQRAQGFAEPNGRRFLMPGAKKDRDCILLFGEQGLERTIFPDLGAHSYKLGNMAWGRDNHLYASVAVLLDNAIAQVAIAEISLETGETRLIPVTRVNWEHLRDKFHSYVSLDISPDRKTVAIATTAVPEKVITKDSRALYLIDLRDPKRHVTRVTFPATVAARN